MKYSKLILAKYVIITGVFLISNISIAQSVEVWLTTEDETSKLSKKNDLSFGSGTNSGIVIDIDDTISYQTMDGFGAAMTGSSAYLIKNEMSTVNRNTLLDDLFSENGIGLTFIRHTIGSSDFSLSSWTYNDNGPDPNLNNFTLDQDNDVISMIQQSLQRNSSIKVLGSPWSAPAWMKENNNLHGGWLDVANYSVYADYLVRYIKGYQLAEIPIWGITLQNEPLHESSGYPSMRMDPNNQISFINNDLGPAMTNAGLEDVKLICHDHNWSNPNYPIDVMNNEDAKEYLAGSAFHGYEGLPSGQTTTHNAHPDKGIWFTEISGGNWATNFGDNLNWYMSNIIIGTIRNWSKSVIYWNIALDSNHGPINETDSNAGCTDCRGVVTIDNDDYTKEIEYYMLGHVSKFVKPGAVRIQSNIDGGIDNVAFKNPDGSKVLVAYNTNYEDSTFNVSSDGTSFNYTLVGRSAVTFKWPSPSLPDVNKWYVLKNRDSGLNMRNQDCSTASQTKVELFNGTGSCAQWRFIDKKGMWTIKNRNSNLNLRHDGSSVINNQTVAELIGTNGGRTHFNVIPALTPGYYHIQHDGSGLNIRNQDCADENDQTLIEFSNGTDNCTQWELIEIEQAKSALKLEVKKSNDSNDEIILFPNPVRDIVQIKTNPEFKNGKIVITNILGNTVYHGNLSETVNVSKLSSGIYYVRIKNIVGKVLIKKMIKQ